MPGSPQSDYATVTPMPRSSTTWPAIALPAELQARAGDPVVAEQIATQQSLFTARKQAYDSQIGAIERRIQQSREDIAAMRSQHVATVERLKYFEEEAEAIRELVEKGYERKPRLLALQRSIAEMRGKIGELDANMARARQMIAQAEFEAKTVRNQRQSDINRELQDAQAAEADLSDRLKAADDVLQEVLMVLVRHARRLAGTPRLGPWLHRVATRLALRRLSGERAARERERIAAALVPPPRSSAYAELAPLIDSALDRLPERERQAVLLHDVEGRTLGEVATAQGCTPSAANMRVRRGRDRLRRDLERAGVAVALPLLLSTLQGLAAGEGAGAAVAAALAPGATPSAAATAAAQGSIGAGAIAGILAGISIAAALTLGAASWALVPAAVPPAPVSLPAPAPTVGTPDDGVVFRWDFEHGAPPELEFGGIAVHDGPAHDRHAATGALGKAARSGANRRAGACIARRCAST